MLVFPFYGDSYTGFHQENLSTYSFRFFHLHTFASIPFYVIIAFRLSHHYRVFFSDCNGIRTHDHLVRKRKLSYLAKSASLAKRFSIHLRAKWSWV